MYLQQLELPLDERYRLAEGLQFVSQGELEARQESKTPLDYAVVCINNCNACPHCDNNRRQ